MRLLRLAILDDFFGRFAIFLSDRSLLRYAENTGPTGMCPSGLVDEFSAQTEFTNVLIR
ncbi:MAG: hypothetical protein Q7U28_09115 [Aquabacterium sp.]|nr:hypothetical protein [Aquabacterium sp.]